MNLIQSMAVKYYRTIDATGFLYSFLRDLHPVMRLIFYTGFTLFTLFVFYKAQGLFPLEKYGLQSVYTFFAYATASMGAFMASYETIYSLNVKAVIAAQKEQEKFIKTHKLQKWRLRNMHFIVRFLVYMFIYFVIVNLIQAASILAFFETFPQPTQEQVIMLESEYRSILSYFSMIFITVVLAIEYFVKKTQLKRIQNV